LSGGERVSTPLPGRALPCGHRRKKSNPAAEEQPGYVTDVNDGRPSGERYFAAASRLLTSFQLMTL
jgi:hypothetical protein